MVGFSALLTASLMILLEALEKLAIGSSSNQGKPDMGPWLLWRYASRYNLLDSLLDEYIGTHLMQKEDVDGSEIEVVWSAQVSALTEKSKSDGFNI
jgi:hypothetical protein